jgi:hypothetical protein
MAASADEQLVLDWLARAADAFQLSARAVEPAGRTCNCCGAPFSVARYTHHDIVCSGCGAVWDGGRSVSADDGAAAMHRRSEPTLLDEHDARHASNLKHDRRVAHQSYQRQYHFNERIAARQNVEPRIPARILRLLGLATRFALGVPRNARLRPGQLTPQLLQSVARAFKPVKLDIYAERWVQLRYYLLTGRTERASAGEPDGAAWDLEWYKDSEWPELRRLFRLLAQCFDELFYRPSTRFTTKDYRVVTSKHSDARHNILQLNYMIQRITLAALGRERYDELRTEWCFPTSRSPKARAKLDRMFSLMCAHLKAKGGDKII